MPCRRLSILDGMTLGALERQLASMQQAYLALVSGTKAQSASYTQADGSRSVAYTQTNIADLVQAIIGVQTQIDALRGLCRNRRRPVTPYF
ncbi:gpW family head-tail joining protein [Paraburkholderia sp. UCT2]|uniref:gpW family head-tail joining protein n=1 Tax=Paraburkholderia sp. UCT2 TaxID=2615208 RepID=UPI0016567236|nr:gpW family head-tail joining protein [Paraburkholderia sp. UCT2]MBC8729430.1 phage head-tail adapter protein [Paraburkholderia sp. UCT2]